jgi:hypothetical protein
LLAGSYEWDNLIENKTRKMMNLNVKKKLIIKDKTEWRYIKMTPMKYLGQQAKFANKSWDRDNLKKITKAIF